MPKYVARAEDYYDDDGKTARDIIVEDESPQDTGLIDQFGNKLCRVKDRLPVGFRVK